MQLVVMVSLLYLDLLFLALARVEVVIGEVVWVDLSVEA